MTASVLVCVEILWQSPLACPFYPHPHLGRDARTEGERGGRQKVRWGITCAGKWTYIIDWTWLTSLIGSGSLSANIFLTRVILEWPDSLQSFNSSSIHSQTALHNTNPCTGSCMCTHPTQKNLYVYKHSLRPSPTSELPPTLYLPLLLFPSQPPLLSHSRRASRVPPSRYTQASRDTLLFSSV